MPSRRSEPAGVRDAAVAGTFYPGDPLVLREAVTGALADAEVRCPARPKALVVPHAGYVYSGPIAAAAYAQLRAPGPPVERVVLLGPSHHVPLDGLALPEAAAFATPLGLVPVDAAAAERALALRQVTRSEAAHRREHSLEVQLPFLQVALGPFTLVPLAVGHASPEVVAEVLDALWGGPETLLLVSTDLSHYLSYQLAHAVDCRTAAQVLALEAHGLQPEQACGQAPLAGLLLSAQRHRLSARLLDLRSSGDTAGDHDRVVGYGAFAFEMPQAGDEPRARRAAVVTGLARAAIAALLDGSVPAPPAGAAWLDEPGACFVSLHHHGRLRGCIGTLVARRPLGAEIIRCARAAASDDTRFSPVRAEELPGLEIEVSILSPLEPLTARDEAEALAAMRPGVDGLLLEAEGRAGTFIPAMWEELPEPRAFLAALRRKAGLPDRWLPGTRLQRFTAERCREVRT
jgi:MEMO1 family protein